MTKPTIDSLRGRRFALGASLEEVGDVIGVRASTVLRWERGTITPHKIMFAAWEAAIRKLERGHG